MLALTHKRERRKGKIEISGRGVGSRTLIPRWANQSCTFRNGTRPHIFWPFYYIILFRVCQGSFSHSQCGFLVLFEFTLASHANSVSPLDKGKLLVLPSPFQSIGVAELSAWFTFIYRVTGLRAVGVLGKCLTDSRGSARYSRVALPSPFVSLL